MKKYCTLLLILFLSAGCAKKPEYLLGIQVPVGDDRVSESMPYVVTGVYEDSPAYNAGIRPDDIITQVDGTDLIGLKNGYVYKKLLLGEKGTDVTIVVKRKEKTMVFVVKRGG